VRNAYLVDSSAVLALLDAADPRHQQAVETAEGLAAGRAVLVQTNYLWAETHALLLARRGRAAARAWLLSRALPIAAATASEEARAVEIVRRYREQDFSLCDAISFAFVEQRGLAGAFAFDRHFRSYARFPVVP
jgi:hypothetical protein